MEIGPIFRALTHQKSRFWLITLEIALTLAIVANCLHLIAYERAKMQRPTGMDEEHILAVVSEPFTPEFEDPGYVQASYEDDLRVLRALPGVRAATGILFIPLSGLGGNVDRRVAGTESEPIAVPWFIAGTDVVETLGVELIAGRDFVESDFPGTVPTEAEDEDDARAMEDAEKATLPGANVIITKELADRLFPDGNAVGGRIEPQDGSRLDTVVGVIARMHGSWPNSPVAEQVMLYPGRPAIEQYARYMVRTEPGMTDDLYTRVESELARANGGRIVTVRSLAEVKAETYRSNTAVTQMLGGLSLLLVLVTSLGIIGLTSFSVAQRTREIGTRRALGATRLAILRYFLVENWLVTSAGLALGLALTYGLNYALAHGAAAPRIGWTPVATGMLLLWLAGLVAALAPAWRGTTVPPVVATRTV
ncbi:MAG: FtsX-like permease family protein [Acidobacteriota bacterium]|jgi:putative ABC transport system permease protein